MCCEVNKSIRIPCEVPYAKFDSIYIASTCTHVVPRVFVTVVIVHIIYIYMCNMYLCVIVYTTYNVKMYKYKIYTIIPFTYYTIAAVLSDFTTVEIINLSFYIFFFRLNIKHINNMIHYIVIFHFLILDIFFM